jgi:hypothetical protein
VTGQQPIEDEDEGEESEVHCCCSVFVVIISFLFPIAGVCIAACCVRRNKRLARFAGISASLSIAIILIMMVWLRIELSARRY